MGEQEAATNPCPRCGGVMMIIGGRRVSGRGVDYVRCACGYSGDQWDEDGVVYDIDPPFGTDAYAQRIEEIASDPANIVIAERTRAEREAERAAREAERDPDTPW